MYVCMYVCMYVNVKKWKTAIPAYKQCLLFIVVTALRVLEQIDVGPYEVLAAEGVLLNDVDHRVDLFVPQPVQVLRPLLGLSGRVHLSCSTMTC